MCSTHIEMHQLCGALTILQNLNWKVNDPKWPIGDLWPHCYWSHMCHSRLLLHVPCILQVPWKYIKVCGYSDHFSRLKPKYHIIRTYIHMYNVQNEWSHVFPEQGSGETKNVSFLLHQIKNNDDNRCTYLECWTRWHRKIGGNLVEPDHVIPCRQHSCSSKTKQVWSKYSCKCLYHNNEVLTMTVNVGLGSDSKKQYQ